MFSECLERASEEEEEAVLDSGERIVPFDSKRGEGGEGRRGANGGKGNRKTGELEDWHVRCREMRAGSAELIPCRRKL